MPWGSGGLNTHDLLVLILEDSRSSVHPDDLEWVPSCLFSPRKGKLFSYVFKSQSHSYVMKKISYVLKQSLCMSCISLADSAIKKEIHKKRMI